MIPQDTKPKKRVPIWIASIVGLIVACMLGSMITLVLHLGAFTFWRSLSSPPSGAVRIIDAQEYRIWVEAGDGGTYGFTSRCSEIENCNQWMLLDNSSQISTNESGIDREKDCHGFWGYPLLNNPLFGSVTECVNARVFHPEMKIDTFFALMSDGTIRYSTHEGLDFILHFLMAAFILLLLVALILLRVYRGSFVSRRQRAS